MGIVIGQLGISAGTYDDIFQHETVSRSIYVAATGSDTTGDGTVGAPFLTISKALSTVKKIIEDGVLITISIGAGTFAFSNADAVTVASIYGDGELIFEGNLTLIKSGFTIGATDPVDPFKRTVSGGDTATWLTDEFQFKFIKQGTTYFPISHNSTTWLSVASAITLNTAEIYQVNTIINWNTEQFTCRVSDTRFRYLEFNITYSGSTLYFNTVGSQLTITVSKYYAATQKQIQASAFAYVTAQTCCTENVGWIGAAQSLMAINASYMKVNSSSSAYVAAGESLLNGISACIFENPNTGSSAACIDLRARLRLTSGNIKFHNSNVGILMRTGAELDLQTFTTAIVFSSCNYLLRKVSVFTDYSKAIVTLTTYYGAPATRWSYDTLYEMINPTTGRYLFIKNIFYPEFETNLATTLLNGVSTDIIVGSKLQNRSIFLDYEIARGSDYACGTVKITHNGTTIAMQQDTQLSADTSTPISTVGCTFAVAFSGNNIVLRCTLTDTTPNLNAVLRYNAARTLISPLTI